MFFRFSCVRTFNKIEIIKKWCRLHFSFIVPYSLKLIHSLYFSFSVIWKRMFNVNPAYNLIIGMNQVVNWSEMDEDLGWNNGFKRKQNLFKLFLLLLKIRKTSDSFIFLFVSKLQNYFTNWCFTAIVEFDGKFKVVLLILLTALDKCSHFKRK